MAFSFLGLFWGFMLQKWLILPLYSSSPLKTESNRGSLDCHRPLRRLVYYL